MKRAIKRALRRVGFLPAKAPPAAAPPAADHRGDGDRARDAADWPAAAAAYARHLAVRTDDFDIWVQHGHALKESGDLDGAAASYAHANGLRVGDADLLLQRGHLERLRKDLVAAAGYYQLSYAADQNVEALRALTASDLQDALATAGLRPARRPVGAVEHLSGAVIGGWARDPLRPKTPPLLQVLVNGRLVLEAACEAARDDVPDAGHGVGYGFAFDLSGKVDLSARPVVSVRLASTGEPLANTPMTAERSPEARAWLDRHKKIDPHALAALQADARQLDVGRLSIIMPVYNTPEPWLREAIASVESQWCPHWELICVDDGSTVSHVAPILDAAAARDDRIRIVRQANGGIARATNAGFKAATGDYVVLMDHDDMLEPEAVYRLLETTANGADLIYADEIVTSADLDDIEHFVARPAFSHDYYLSHPYVVHPICVRRQLALKLGGFDEGMAISADVDFVLRVIEAARDVAHIPAFLYRWRTHRGSTGHARKGEVTAATLGALNAHLARLKTGATAIAGPHFNTYRICWPDPGGRTLIVIPTRDRVDLLKPCIDSIFRTVKAEEVTVLVVDHQSRETETADFLAAMGDRITVLPYVGAFNFSAINNAAVAAHGAGHDRVLFMNNDVEALAPGWLEEMRALCGRPDVGAVGATLLYDDGTVQHAGVILGIGGSADHAHKFQRFQVSGRRTLGFNCSLVSTRDYSAVTGACLMLPMALFESVGGFDERLVVGYNDTDLCLRVGALGYRVLNSAHAVLWHHESASRRKSGQIDHPVDGCRFVQRWAGLIAQGDPFYSPHLSLKRDHRLDISTDPTAAARVRAVTPTLQPASAGKPRLIEAARFLAGHVPAGKRRGKA